MPEAVIAAAARSPIGRAFKGSLVELRPDDMAAQMVRAVLAKVPELDPALIEDLPVGNAQPAGEAGYTSPGWRPSSPGWPMCRAPRSTGTARLLQTIRMAAHAIKAGEGDVFVAAGVEAVSRFGNGMSDGMPNTTNPRFDDAPGPPRTGPSAGDPPGRLNRACRTSTSRWARPRKTSASSRASPERRWTASLPCPRIMIVERLK